MLVDADAVIGLIDFGDAVHSATVGELAVASAYAMLDKDDPWAVARSLRHGFEEFRPLSVDERDALPHLIRTRLAISVSIAADQQRQNPNNPYLGVSEAPAWRLLERITERTHG